MTLSSRDTLNTKYITSTFELIMNKLINYVLNTQQMLKSVTKTLANAETVAGKKTVN